jgi:endoglucanase
MRVGPRQADSSPMLTRYGLLLLLGGYSASLANSWIRVNQLGYLPQARKVAVLVCLESGVDPPDFVLHDALTGEALWRSRSVKAFGPYAAFQRTYRLDFSSFRKSGAYFLSTAGTRSPSFRIDRSVYKGAADFVLRYMRQQRSGYNPFLADSCHTRDGFIVYHPTLDSTHIDVSGGWHDASDYLQYVATSANAVFQMLFAYEQHPALFRDDYGADGLPGRNGTPDILDEARWGLLWLSKMNPSAGMMFNQIADDRDHRGFRLPTLDTVDYGMGRQRPVYFCTGEPQGLYQNRNRSTGIASTAGKYASAFAAAARVLLKSDPAAAAVFRRKALEAYRFGREHPGVCQTAPCRSPYFYEEDNWVDDMELAATQLQGLFPDSTFIDEAAAFGAREPVTPWMGADSARHYQWYPFVNLGHYYLGASRGDRRAEFLAHMRTGLQRIFDRARTNPFLFGVPFIWCSNNLVVAALTQARLYHRLSGDSSFVSMEASLRDWLFGCNPWGTSMIVGLPSDGISPRDPHSAFSHVNGLPIDGGLVDGPVYTSIFSSLRGVALSAPDAFAAFQSKLAVYHDDWGDYSTNEPTMDGTASLTYYLSALEAEGDAGPGVGSVVLSHGGIIRMDSTQRQVFLVFTGHEFADGGQKVRAVLKQHHAKGSFFFTGDFYRNPEYSSLIRDLRKDGHYLGAHSDRHLLYASWENRDSLLVTKETFREDLLGNYRAMERFGIRKGDAPYFMPPYEWYNSTVSRWCNDAGLTLVNFTPGTGSNADYTFPGPGQRYVSSDSIFERILKYEEASPAGLNGFILLMHIGADPRRPDKFTDRLDDLLTTLKRRGYRFSRL